MSTNQTAQVATGRDAVLAAVELFSFLDGLQLHWLSAPDIDFLAPMGALRRSLLSSDG
ncbi:hypothetical protein [Actinomadura nitritigenes]|uniref:hypothetical protein n=1 Tax=Actinomadura nitritigenes TaxID=134602 RepID=UPI003D89F2ED